MTPGQRRWIFLAGGAGLVAFYLWGLTGLPGTSCPARRLTGAPHPSSLGQPTSRSARVFLRKQ